MVILGAIYYPSDIEEEVIKKDFSDFDFFVRFVPWLISNGAQVAIASYANYDENSLLSGQSLIQRYLDVAFPGRSLNFFPKGTIEAWNPEKKKLKSNVVGKVMHLNNLRARCFPNVPKRSIVLFDDSQENVSIVIHSYICIIYIYIILLNSDV